MASETDFYELLEVPRSCDAAALKAAYRKAAMRWHPDRNPGDKAAETRFKAVNEAYAVLSDPQKRAAYDRYGVDGVRGGNGGGNPFGGAGGNPFSDIFSDIFDQFMGGAQQRRQGPQRGADVRYDLEVSLEEAFYGSKAEVAFDVGATCSHCLGSGGKPGARPEPCTTCHGRGQVRMQNGMFIVERTCPTCHGAGTVISDPCTHCHGEGRITQHKTLEIDIPKGVDDGTRIRLAGEGEAGPRGGGPGDLYIFVHLKPHEIWQRDGTTLYAQVPLSFVDAALGTEFEIPGLDHEPVSLRVPPGTQNGRQFRIRGRGMPALNGRGMGDMVVQMELETPTGLTDHQRELLQEFRGSEGGANACPKSKGFWDRLKGAWDELTE